MAKRSKAPACRAGIPGSNPGRCLLFSIIKPFRVEPPVHAPKIRDFVAPIAVALGIRAGAYYFQHNKLKKKIEMKMRFYNTLTRKKEEFKPIEPGKVKFYSCGPTVYNYAHIGNLRTYVFNDILKKSLNYAGFSVNHVMNITDVGHLTDDADDGEDKMEKGAKREGKTVWEVAEFYTEEFKKDIKKLNIEEPDNWPKATEHIPEIIELNQVIEEKGYAYRGNNGNLYFDTSKFDSYAELAKLNLEQLNEGARTEKDENKRNPTDFVLWFNLEGSKFGENHTMRWDSPWGVGYPGWHIECCAMSSKYLGDHFDIHSGGIDHIPVHHTNEIAQAEAAFEKHPWVNYWLHANFLVIDKGKMAKSGDNFLKLALLEEKGYEPLAYRYFCLTAHYRSELSFSWDAMDNSQKSFNKFKSRIIELKESEDNKCDADPLKYEDKFLNAITDDLNMPVALATAQEVLNDKNLSKTAKLNLLLKFDTVLSLGIADMKKEKVSAPQEVSKLLDERADSRARKDFQKSDELREEIRRLGYEVIDGKEGQELKKIN